MPKRQIAMTSQYPLPPRIVMAIRRFEKAVEAYSWIGSKDPEMYDEIENEYQLAREHLRKVIKEVM